MNYLKLKDRLIIFYIQFSKNYTAVAIITVTIITNFTILTVSLNKIKEIIQLLNYLTIIYLYFPNTII